jgi:uncharacterized membrane protein
MQRYRSRLEQDLARWQAAGFVTSANVQAIKADADARGGGVGLAPVLATLAAVLIGFAAMSFVAANWQAMGKLSRLTVIFGSLWALVGGSYALSARNLPRLADAALLAAVAVFGAGIMLVAQMYHMDGNPPDAVWLWGIGALAVGLLLRANSVLAAALVLFVVWSWMEAMTGNLMFGFDRSTGSRIHWGFLPYWAAVAVGVAVTRWRFGLHLLAIALTQWVIASGYMVGRGDLLSGHGPVLIVGLLLMAASILAGETIDRWRQISGTMLNYGMVIAFAGAIALQFVVDKSGSYTLITGLLALAGILGTLAWAWRTDNRPAMWIAYICFAVEIFSLYLKKVGTLLGTSGFFLGTGLMVAAFAYVAYRLHDSRAIKPGVAA